MGSEGVTAERVEKVAKTNCKITGEELFGKIKKQTGGGSFN